jgi:DNA-binding MarR family transcriptional regulator
VPRKTSGLLQPVADLELEKKDSPQGPARAPIDETPLRQLVGYNIRRASVNSHDHFLRTLSKWKLRPAEYSALALIAANPLTSQAGIASALCMTRPNMVGLIAGLERRGLVTRKVSTQDRRNQMLQLTRRGKALLAEADALILPADQRITSRLTDRERAQLLDLLQRLY